RHLLALVRMDQEHDFVMTHCVFLVDAALAGLAAPRRPGWKRWGKGPPACTQARRAGNYAGSGTWAQWRAGNGPGGLEPAQAGWVVKLSPQPHSALAFGFLKMKPSPRPWRAKSISVPSTSGRLVAST